MDEIRKENKDQEHSNEQNNLSGEELAVEKINKEELLKDKPSYFEAPIKLQEEALRRKGYFVAIEHPSLPYERFQQLITQHTDRENLLVEETTLNSSIEIDRYKERIRIAREQKAALEAEIEEYKNEVDGRQEEKQGLEQSLEKVKERIYNFFRDLSSAKKEVLENRIKEVNDSLLQLIEGQRKVLDNEKLPFKNYLDRGQNLAQDIIDRYDALSHKVADRLNEIQQLMLCFDIKGLSPVVLNFLISTGFVAAVVAGWFFANFTLLSDGSKKNEWLNSGFISNLITAALNFVRTHNKWDCLIYLGVFLGFVTLLSALADIIKWLYRHWLADRIRKVGPGKGKSNFEFKTGLSELEGLPFSLEINSETMFIFWLEILPLVFIAGVTIIILSYNESMFTVASTTSDGKPALSVDSIAGQLVSLTSEIAGFLMSIALGAIYYLYLAHKGKKLCKEENPLVENNKSWYIRNWEFAIIIAFVVLVNLFILVMLGIISIWDYGLNSHALGAITLAQFLLYANAAGLCIGFGTYGKGLVSQAGWLEFKLDATSAKVKYFYQNSLSLFFTNDFDAKYKRIQEEILDLLGQRLNPEWSAKEKTSQKGDKRKVTAKADTAASNEKRQSFYERLLRLLSDIRYFLTGQKTAVKITDAVNGTALSWEMSKEDVAFYPELAIELESYNKQRKDIEAQLDEIKNAHIGFYGKTSFRYTKLSDTLKLIDSRIENWYWRIRQIRDNLPVRLKLIRDEALQERTIMQDGYDLGIWYRENEIGPYTGYYQLYKNQKP
jgi:hypothetical protein